MRSAASPANEPDAGFTLDPVLLAERRAASARRVHTVQIPRIRAVGFAILSLIMLLHDWRFGRALEDPSLRLVVAANLGYAALSWWALKVGYGRTGRVDLSLVMLHVDILLWLANLHHVESTNLFFALLLLVRVTDQVGFGFRRALYFDHVVAVAYVGYAWWIAMADPADERLLDRLMLAGIMYMLGVYLAFTGAVTERLRDRMRQAMRTARELVDRLEAKTQALQSQAAELEAARRQAEQASVAKSQFLAMISHELRTPMNGILGTTELLLGAPLDDTQRRYARTAHRSATHLLGLMDDLLDLASIEAGKLALNPRVVDVSEIARDAVELVSATARDKAVRLQCSLPLDMPPRLECDPVRLRQLLVNLLHNAVRFTEHGHVELEVAIVERLPGALRLRFVVSDTGIGIPEDELDSVFDAFTQADASRDRRLGGTGLGLAIVRELAQVLGAQIDVQSRLGEGSVFGFELTLPVAAAPAEAPPPGAQEKLSAHVLLAEDDAVNQMVVEALLKQLGCTVDVVADGASARAAVAHTRYDVVFMDCRMPGMDGVEATRFIRGDEEGHRARTPIVALTADALPSERDRCLTAGMDDFVTKPVDLATLAAAVRRWTGMPVRPTRAW